MNSWDEAKHQAILAECGLDLCRRRGDLRGSSHDVARRAKGLRREGLHRCGLVARSFRRARLDAARRWTAYHLHEVRAYRRRSVLPRANGSIRTTPRPLTATGSSGRRFARTTASFAGRRSDGRRRTRPRRRSTFGWTPTCWPISAPPAAAGNRGSTRRSARRRRCRPSSSCRRGHGGTRLPRRPPASSQ
jgi:hypothetical protein